MTDRTSFRRLVLGLHPQAPDPVLRLAAEFASRLHLDLLGYFLEDRNLIGLAGLPFAREIRPFGGTWHSLDLDVLAQEVALASQRAERSFNEAVRGLRTTVRFEIVRGSASETIEAVLREGDIILLPQPSTPGEQVAHPFASLQQAALRSAGAVLLVPVKPVRRTGPVVAIAVSPADPSVGTAAAIARTLDAELVVLRAQQNTGSGRERPPSHPPQAGERRIEAKNLSTAPGLMAAFGSLREQLIVATRGALADEVFSLIASLRSVPVMLVEPAPPDESEPEQNPT